MDSPYTLAKTSYKNGKQCRKYLYLGKHFKELEDEISISTQERFNNGRKVEELAHLLFPNGENSNYRSDLNAINAVERTQELILNGCNTIYEAAFIANDCLTLIDILSYDGSSWIGYEVKSSTKVKDDHLVDVSYQYYVCKNAGLELKDFFVVFVNNEYTIPDCNAPDLNEYFKYESVIEKILECYASTEKAISEYKDILQLSSIPEIPIGSHCKKPYDCNFKGFCWKDIPENSIFNIPNLSLKKRDELLNEGIVDILNIPESFDLTPRQRMHINTAKSGKPHIDYDSLNKFLDELRYPLYFFDLETIFTPIPIYDNIRAYQQIPFQYSLHIVGKKGESPGHFEYLVSGNTDPRRELIETFISQIGERGDILAYSAGFERGKLKDIGDSFPEYQQHILNIIPRIKDLMFPFINKHYYHAEMKGYYSIKEVLPILVPGMGYNELEIQDGTTAGIMFLRYIKSADEHAKEKLRNDLLKYCHMDTFAMVKILEALYRITN